MNSYLDIVLLFIGWLTVVVLVIMIARLGEDIMKKKYKFMVYKDKKDEWRFRLLAPNGRIVADSGEGYKDIRMCKRNIKRICEQLSSNNYEIVESD